MRVGVGLPSGVPGAPGPLVPEWASRAEAAGFASAAAIDRMGYGSWEPLVALAAAAAVTERLLLATTVLIAPLRSPAVLAKQVASLQILSQGRVVLGVGIGARSDDYRLAGMEAGGRSRRLEEHLETLPDLLSEGGAGMAAARPVFLVGGASGAAHARMASYADGYIHGGGPPRAFARAAEEARAAWADAERPGRPQLWGQSYFAFGSAAGAGREYVRDYYAFTGPFAERIASGLLQDRHQVAEQLAGYAEAGCDHLCLYPAVAELAQLHELAAAVAGAGWTA